jgi:hypothetical protein
MRFARFAARELLVVMRNLRVRRSAGSIHNRSADRASALLYRLDCGRWMVETRLGLRSGVSQIIPAPLSKSARRVPNWRGVGSRRVNYPSMRVHARYSDIRTLNALQ